MAAKRKTAEPSATAEAQTEAPEASKLNRPGFAGGSNS